MPQGDPIGHVITTSGDTIILRSGELPPGFDTLPPDAQEWIREAIVEKPVTEPEHKSEGSNTPMYLFLAVLIIGIIIRFRRNLETGRLDNESMFEDDEEESYDTPQIQPKEYLTYYGSELNFSSEELIKVLTKHSTFFNQLTPEEKEKFLHRVKSFIGEKIFYIHDTSGFKEMPILISAAAIQVSFGLKKYLLPNFRHIHIYPNEFIGVYPTIRVLAGNVSGHSINISWKHFLEGYQSSTDGSNLALHEMAHAYYFQNFETGENVDADFVDRFPGFNYSGNKAFEAEALPGKDLYSDYAMRNFQEFWAESVEIFFEKPVQMKLYYPDLYIAMTQILNQDPVTKTDSSMSA